MKRVFAVVEVKEIDDEERVIRGIATAGSVDRMGDIVDPSGVTSAASIPLFLYHDSQLTVGRATLGKAKDGRIPFTARLPKVKETGRLRDRVDEAWQMLKYELINAVSIGFNVIGDAYERMKEGGYRFLKTEVLELSLVPIPAQPEAVITALKSFDAEAIGAVIKSLDEQHLAARGRKGADGGRRPGAAGHQAGNGNTTRNRKETIMKTLKELNEARATKAARLQELVDIFKTDDHDPTDEENAEFDQLTDEVKALDGEIRIARFHAINSAAAKAVDTETNSGRKGPMVIVKRADPDEKFKGQAYTRLAIAKAVARMAGNGVRPSDIAQARWGKTHPQLIGWIKANEVAGGGSGSGEWGAELVAMDGRYTGDFIDYLKSATVYDKLPLREVPANVTIKGQDGTATGYWVGQSKAIPTSTVDFSSVNLTPLKVGALAVMSKELIQDSSPSAEMLVAEALRDASSQRIDSTFLSTTAASSGVSPAGLLNGLSAGSASGTDADALRVDIQTLYGGFLTAKMASGLWIAMQPALAKSIGLMVNALGQTEFPGLNADGGTLLGDRVVTGDNVGSGDMILLKPSEIYKIGDSGVEVSASDVAMIEQSSAPTGATDTPTAASQAFTSMFQEESVAIKVVRRINYAKRRTGVVAYIGNGAYGPVSGS